MNRSIKESKSIDMFVKITGKTIMDLGCAYAKIPSKTALKNFSIGQIPSSNKNRLGS